MVTERISKYVKDKGISVAKIAEQTGVGYQILCRCFSDKFKRELGADEVLLVCRYLEV